jgi:hypothetical protein
MHRRAFASVTRIFVACLAILGCEPSAPQPVAPVERLDASLRAPAARDAAAESYTDGGNSTAEEAAPRPLPVPRAPVAIAADASPVAPPPERPAPTPTPTIALRDLVFFDLPIDSLRYAVSGHDRATGLCITAVFFLNEQAPLDRRCDDFDHTWFPYVVVEPADAAGCWDYGSDVTLESARGCVDWAAFGPTHADEATLELSIESPLFSGRVLFEKPR